MHRTTHAHTRPRTESSAPESRSLRSLRPPPSESDLGSSLDELSASLCSPDDVPVEIEDLAAHFLWEATQSSMPSSPAPATEPGQSEADAELREAFFEESGRQRERLREFERIWKHIISRELVSTEL